MMKRTITLRVAVHDDSEYASLLAQLHSCPKVTAWTAEHITPRLRTMLRKHGISGEQVEICTPEWVKQNG